LPCTLREGRWRQQRATWRESQQWEVANWERRRGGGFMYARRSGWWWCGERDGGRWVSARRPLSTWKLQGWCMCQRLSGSALNAWHARAQHPRPRLTTPDEAAEHRVCRRGPLWRFVLLLSANPCEIPSQNFDAELKQVPIFCETVRQFHRKNNSIIKNTLDFEKNAQLKETLSSCFQSEENKSSAALV
jgi:hypothetical protein